MQSREIEDRPYAIMLDDDVATVEMYRLGLEIDGFRVTVVTDAEALLRAAKAEIPDVFVLDWQLQGMTGGDVLELLRAQRKTAAVPAVILSNFSQHLDGAVDRVFQAGAIAWFTKSCTTPPVLAAKLREALKHGTAGS